MAGAARRAGVTSAVVPDWFPVGCADALRAAGMDVTVDDMVIRSRRRTKSPAEVAAIEEALRVTEASLELIRERLRQATVDERGALLLDGVALTSERLQGEVRGLSALHRCEGDVPIVAGGAQAADGVECGHGPLHAGEPIVCDIFPRHSETRFHGDMTRVFCVGRPTPELVRAHDCVRRANELRRAHSCGPVCAASRSMRPSLRCLIRKATPRRRAISERAARPCRSPTSWGKAWAWTCTRPGSASMAEAARCCARAT